MKRALYVTAIAFALAAIAATGTFAFPQNPPRQRAMMGQGRGGPGPMGMLRQLNLTDDQRTKIQTLADQHRQAMQDQAQKMRDLQKQLKDAIFADAGPGNTDAVQQQIAALETQLQSDRIAFEKQIAAVLTADQRKQVRDLPGPGFGPMGRGRGMGRGPGW